MGFTHVDDDLLSSEMIYLTVVSFPLIYTAGRAVSLCERFAIYPTNNSLLLLLLLLDFFISVCGDRNLELTTVLENVNVGE